jgi:hypothetical protein
MRILPGYTGDMLTHMGDTSESVKVSNPSAPTYGNKSLDIPTTSASNNWADSQLKKRL